MTARHVRAVSESSEEKTMREYDGRENNRHRAYVGAAGLYDFIGASQFALAVSCGLREGHTLLDFGCGSLRGGRFFIPYLQPGGYYGVEPNKWLVEKAFAQEIGEDVIRLKKPHFAYVDDFSVPFDQQFDFVMAQSIFTHMGRDLAARLFTSLAAAVKKTGLIMATFFVGDKDEQRQGWIYFDTVPRGESVATPYTPTTITALADQAGLFTRRVRFHHPRNQQWFLFSAAEDRLPSPEQAALFYGLNIMPPLP